MVMEPKCGCIAARCSWQQLLLRLLLQWQILRYIVSCCAARKHPPTFWNDLLGVTRGGGQQATSIVAGARIKCPHTLVVFPFCMGSNMITD
jgi:hypothetical protein